MQTQPVPVPAPAKPESRWKGYLIGCSAIGCLSILLIIAVSIALALYADKDSPDAAAIDSKVAGKGAEKAARTVTSKPWTHAGGEVGLAVPDGWSIEASGDRVDLTPMLGEARASLRIKPQLNYVNARTFAEMLLAKTIYETAGRSGGYRALSHTEGTTTDKRHARSSVGCEVTRDDKVWREDYHVVLAKERAFVLLVQAPKADWDASLPELKSIVAGMVVHSEPRPKASSEIIKDKAGRYEVAVPAGWSSRFETTGQLLMALYYEGGRMIVESVDRHAAYTIADVAASDNAQLFANWEKERGATIEVVSRKLDRGGGAGIDTANVMFRAKYADGKVNRVSVHVFLSEKLMTTIIMKAPEELWALWLPDFQQVWRSLKIADKPLAGAGGRDPRVQAASPASTQ